MEERLLLYATLGANWTYGSRITYSFVPDGTPVGSTPSSLYQTLSSLGSPTVWQAAFARAAAVWQASANINLVQVSDNGAGLGSPGYQQGSPYYGDIRISAIPLSAGTLGAAYSPPPINGGSLAGDIVLNSNVAWKINANYDLETVAIHELGHALGMDHSSIGQAVMYYYYNGIKQSLSTDDVAGIDSIGAYGPRQYDAWNSNGQNNQWYANAKSLDRFRTAQNQITLTNLDITEDTMTEWFWVTIPQNNIGRFTVTAQSTGLSLLTPDVAIFNPSLGYVGSTDGVSSGYGSSTAVTTYGVTTGQGFFIKISAGGGASGGTGAYALQINFGNSTMPLVPPPYTTVAAQPGIGGISQMTTATGPIAPSNSTTSRGFSAAGLPSWLSSLIQGDQDHQGVIQVGDLSAWGDALLVGPTPAARAQAPIAASSSFDASGMRTTFNEAADAMRLGMPSSAFANPGDGHAGAITSIDHALAGWNTDWSSNQPSRGRRHSWRF